MLDTNRVDLDAGDWGDQTFCVRQLRLAVEALRIDVAATERKREVGQITLSSIVERVEALEDREFEEIDGGEE
jgi:hypothetical protein